MLRKFERVKERDFMSNSNEDALLTKEFLENVLINQSELKTSQRRLVLSVFITLTVLITATGGAAGWLYYKYYNPHVRYIRYIDGKTYIGLTDAERIDADPDREYGGSLIQVVHRAKK
jgi:hypothetical protein